MGAVEVLDGDIELVTLLTVAQQLDDLLAPLDILGLSFPNSTLLALNLVTSRLESVGGELSTMFFLSLLGLGMPGLALIVREVLPRHANDLGQSAVVSLHL
jgi:hypothetical protein